MKNLIFTGLTIIVLLPIANAQKIRWGFTAGATLGQISTKSDGNSNNTGWLFGPSVGVTADIPLSKNFSFQPSLQYLQKGGKETENSTDPATTTSIRLSYLELPMNFLYRAPGTKGHFIFGLGPSIAYGLGGKAKVSEGSESGSTSIKFGSGADDLLKPFEISGNILAGYEWNNGIFFQIYYNHALNNIYNNYDLAPGEPSTKWNNSYFGVRIGYFLHTSKK